MRGFVAKHAQLNNYDDVTTFFRGLMNMGCKSGFVLAVYGQQDAHRFFDHYYSEIEALRVNWETQSGQSMLIRGDLKRNLAWFAFERTAYNLAVELELALDT